MEILSSIAQLAFWLCGAVSATLAAHHYRRSVARAATDTLLEIEERLEGFRDFLPEIDPASSHTLDLAGAIEKSVSGTARTPEETAALARLDSFLRLLLLMKVAQEKELFDIDTLADLYHYWFWAVRCPPERAGDPDVHKYVERYFPHLNAFLKAQFPAKECEERRDARLAGKPYPATRRSPSSVW